MKICSLYGAGFYYIPGTDTCLKVGGFVRAEMNFNAGGSFSVATGDHDLRTYNFEYTRVRYGVSVDARSQTAYGTLRSYANLAMQANNGGGGSGIATWSNRGFIQWAGFTAGNAVSFFDFYATPKYSNTANWLGSDSGGTGIDLFAYTAQFGNGFSASLSAEDTSYRRTSIWEGASSYGGRQWPDVVGNLRIDQAWGSAQIMAAAHEARGAVYDQKVGWAVGGGLKLNLPWSKGDSFTAQAAYSKGAMSYVGSGLGTFFESNNGTSVAYGNTYDAVGTGTSLELTTGWSVVAGADHHWNSQWRTSLYGGYGEINYSSAASSVLSGGGTGSADWSFSQIGSRTVWTPVQNLFLSVDLMYNNVQSASAYKGATVAGSNQGWLQGMFRVQRNFWP